MASPSTRQASAELTTADQLRRLWWRHPEVPALILATVAWVYLGVEHWANHDSAARWRFGVGGWAAMVLAMMVPATVPMIRLVAFDSMWHRRVRAPSLFVVSYVTAWTVVATVFALGIAVVESTTAARFDPGTTVVVAVLAVAAGWQFTTAKRRWLRRCHQRTALAPRGWKADRAVVRYGFFHAKACIGSCWLAMGAMFVSAHDFHLMIPLTVILTFERLQPRPRPELGGYGIAALAMFTTCSAFIS